MLALLRTQLSRPVAPVFTQLSLIGSALVACATIGFGQELVRETVTEDGLRIWAMPDDGGDRFIMMVLVGSGARQESESRTGVAHVLEHVLLGSTTEWTKAESSDRLDEFGGSMNGYTKHDVTTFYVQCPSSSWRDAVDWMAKHLVNPALNETDITDECKIVYEELDMSQPHAGIVSFEAWLYPDHALGRDIGGDKSEIKSLDQEDLRKYYEQHYRAPNMAIGFAGKVPEAECVQVLTEAFADLQAGGEVSSIDPVRPWTGSTIESEGAYGSGALLSGYHLPAGDPEEKANQVLISEYLSKRAFDTIREERQLAYSPGFYLAHYADTTRLTFTITVSEQANLSEVSELLEALTKELSLPDQDVFETVKRNADGLLETNTTSELGKAVELAWLMRRSGHSPADLQLAIQAASTGDVAQYAALNLIERNAFQLSIGGLGKASALALLFGLLLLAVVIDAVRGFPWANSFLEYWNGRRSRRARKTPPTKEKIIPIRGDDLEKSFQEFFESEDKSPSDDR